MQADNATATNSADIESVLVPNTFTGNSEPHDDALHRQAAALTPEAEPASAPPLARAGAQAAALAELLTACGSLHQH